MAPSFLWGALQTNNIPNASLETIHMLLKVGMIFCGLTYFLCSPKIWALSRCLSLWAALMPQSNVAPEHAAPQLQHQLSTITLWWGGL